MQSTFYFLILLVSAAASSSDGTTETVFKVGVYDQAELLSAKPSTDRDEALVMLLQQLSIYEKIASSASAQGAVVQVFPQYGLMPLLTTRQQAFAFMENVPDPKITDWNPCKDPSNPGTEIQERLSCIAASNKLYVVANMGSFEPCDPTNDETCPADNHYQYSTNVVFDPTGKLIVRHRKYNVYYMEQKIYDRPPEVDYSYFDTPYGRFGTVVCSEILNKQPTVELIEKFKIDHLLLPATWAKFRPYYEPVVFHQAIAVGLGVNLIVSKLRWSVIGSGVYGPDRTYAYTHDETATDSSLLVAEIPVQIRRTVQKKTTLPEDLVDEVEFQDVVDGEDYNFVMLKSDSGSASVCHGTLCCLLDYTRQPGGDDLFGLGAFAGYHRANGIKFELCTLVKCQQATGFKCIVEEKTSDTFFSFFNLTGNFSTPYVYPSVVSSGIDPSSGDWSYTGQYVISYGTKKPFLSATLYGMVFERDQPGDVDGSSPEELTGSRLSEEL